MCFNLIGNETSDLSIYAQLPQDICISIVQLFALLAVFEFIYFAAPRSARSLFVGLYFFSRQVGSYSGYTADIILEKKSVTLDFQVGMELNKFVLLVFFMNLLVSGCDSSIHFTILYLLLRSCWYSVNVHRYFPHMSVEDSYD